jgi:hypothetical protein
VIHVLLLYDVWDVWMWIDGKPGESVQTSRNSGGVAPGHGRQHSGQTGHTGSTMNLSIAATGCPSRSEYGRKNMEEIASGKLINKMSYVKRSEIFSVGNEYDKLSCQLTDIK